MDHDRRLCPWTTSKSKPFDPWSDLEWEEHDEARRIVADHPDGMTLEEVGAVLGVTRERVRQIESNAMAKLREGIASAEIVVVGDDVVPVLICHGCDRYFQRHGRSKFCERCDPPPKPTRPPRPKPRRAETILPPPPPPPPPPLIDPTAAVEVIDPIEFSLSLVFDFSGL